MKLFLPAVMLILLSSKAGAVDCDSTAGKRSFDAKCGICHSVEASGVHAVGPNLRKVSGREVGRAPGFTYSESLARADGRWTRQRLDDFLSAPQQVFPGTTMPFQGVKAQAERERLICYLETLD